MGTLRSLIGRAAQLWTITSALGVLALCAPRAASQPVVPTGFVDQPMVSALDSPAGMAFLPDGRLLVIEQTSATVNLVILGSPVTMSSILTVPEVSTGGEQGLLGIAIDPGWPVRNYIYVHCTHTGDAKVRISRFLVTGDLDFTAAGDLSVSPTSRYDLLVDVPNAATNHNGGTLRFGPDGMLYASFGEDANRCAAQDTVSLRGVILRLDVSRLPGAPGGPAPKALIAAPGNPFAAHPDSNARLVWALGLRNPFRFHIDMPTGDLFIADVGEGTWEEVDIAPSGGLNFGWPHYEGSAPLTQPCTDNNSAFVAPIHAYNRSGSTAAIISAGRYRRPVTGSDRFPPSYEGDYFFGDYYQGFVRRLVGSGGAWSIAPMVPGQPDALNWGTGIEHVSDWAVGTTGALWYCKQSNSAYQSGTGEIRRLVYAPTSAPSIASVTATAGRDGRSATIRWSTDIASDSRVDYGLQPGTLDQTVAQTATVLDHAVFLGGLEPDTVYFYRVSSTFAGGGTTVFPDSNDPPLDFQTLALPVQLLPPFPSPAIGGATLPYDLSVDAVVTLRLYDLRGRLVRTLIDGETRTAGAHAETTWDGRDDQGRDVAAGVYIVRLGIAGRHLERRLSMIR